MGIFNISLIADFRRSDQMFTNFFVLAAMRKMFKSQNNTKDPQKVQPNPSTETQFLT